MKRSLQLLAPARDADIAIEAIRHGADAVYIGAPAFGARSAARNSVDDIAKVVDYAHKFYAKVYVTLNVVLYDNELDEARRLAWRLYNIGVDALIIQDMALLGRGMPPIALHASTQCDTRTPHDAELLAKSGFSQIVLARELSLAEIGEIHRAVTVPLEAFVHGALCVSYSGDCHASCVALHRSANRGECAQMCRMSYDLTDAAGTRLRRQAHYLSLRDMCRIDSLSALADAGVSSFKIEGRLKDVGYVKNVVAAYSQALDRVVASSPDKYCRASQGQSAVAFTPDLGKSFNRGYTPYFLDGRVRNAGCMASHNTPKWVGEPAGCVSKIYGDSIKARLDTAIHNGDGLTFFRNDGSLAGFRVNRADGDRLYVADMPADLKPGVKLYRNSDVDRDKLLGRQSATRSIGVHATLRMCGGMLALRLASPDGAMAEVTAPCVPQCARTPQVDARQRVIGKLGDTIYRLDSYVDECGDAFVPVSVLASLRRSAVAAFDVSRRCRRSVETRVAPTLDVDTFAGQRLTYHKNVANRAARDFYLSHGALSVDKAVETGGMAAATEIRVMTCRYCLRRELGACLRTPSGKELPQPLYLVNGAAKFRLDFDCDACNMQVVWQDRQ